ncbi:MAG: energy transducer TonB [Pseudomonadota bacterium]
MINRHTLAAVPASACTLALFYAMHTLITLQPAALVEARDRAELDWVRVRQQEQILETEQKPAPIPDVLPPPQVTHRLSETTGEPLRITVTPPPPPGPGPIDAIALGDGPLVAMVRVQPIYPAGALAKNLEGYVVVEFDVDANGHTSNHRVVESSHRLFEQSAIKAAAKFRYQAPVVDGRPVATRGIRSVFRFELEQH